MSIQADQIRDKRRHSAEPGGTHDRLVRFLAVALPGLIGALAAVMIISPLSPRGEVSFLLDRNKVAIAEERLRVDNALYRGQDNLGRPFSLSAGEAVQASASQPVVVMRDLVARILLSDGPAVLQAESGRYDFDREEVVIDGMVRYNGADGYRLVTHDVTIDLKNRSLAGTGRVEGSTPAGSFSADRLMADLAAHSLTLDGNARLRMTPGKLRMP